MPQLAQLVAALALVTPRVPSLPFRQIQACRVASVRWLAEHVYVAPGALHVLLAAVLLVCAAGRKCAMSTRLLAELTRLLRPA
jgi:hypothetical protein